MYKSHLHLARAFGFNLTSAFNSKMRMVFEQPIGCFAVVYFVHFTYVFHYAVKALKAMVDFYGL